MEKFKSILKVLMPVFLVLTTIVSMFGYAFLRKLFDEGSIIEGLMFTSAVLQIIFLILILVGVDDFEDLKQKDDWNGVYFILGINVQPIIFIIGGCAVLFIRYLRGIKKEIGALS